METVPASSDVAVEKQNRVTSSDLATSSTQVQVKEEVAINSLTMNNSKLNAMVFEHRRMDASTTLPLPAGAVGTPKALISIGGNEAKAGSVAAATPAPPAPSEVPISVVNELSNEDLAFHIKSLVSGYDATVSPANLKKRLEVLLKVMMKHKCGWVFNTLSTPSSGGRWTWELSRKKLEVGVYKHTEEFAHDVRLMFQNAMQYNSEDQDVYSLAKDMLADFNGEMRKLVAEIEVDEKAARANECNSRIRRNCYYYISADNKYHCWHQCFDSLSDTIKHNEGRQYNKNELSRKKNDDVHKEPWLEKPQLVKTDSSQTTDDSEASSLPSSSAASSTSLSMTMTTVVKSSSTGFKGTIHSIKASPGKCLLKHRKKDPKKYKVGRNAFSAKDLQRTKLSDFLERRIAKSLQREREDEAKWTQRNVKNVETAEGLTNIEKQLVVHDKMFQWYKGSHKYTSEYRFKSKCIYMFQELEGVSVLLIDMYVHEFDEPIPPHLRTKVYPELLIAYFDFVKRCGFHTAHLWACPHLKGVDYILYCHPEAQKTPKSDRLRTLYVDMLVKAEEEGAVWQITNMYDNYWRNDNTPCALPYFEGDYWVGLVEDLIEKLVAEKNKKSVHKRGAKSQKRKS
ncbi:hypothetical protein PsorP6_002516 [Peronosclerospora sorghi]|uniref:Uncharacterized protein n=1 Tax=Peronosclerospora sorghi TaxID=230839 RepID=A0ACC0WSU4_9STRA|nr:hypothetical protein PsorP6_002516 [Peronosclerospora sorghi]